MRHRPTRSAATGVVTVLSALVLAACTASPSPAPEPSRSSGSAQRSPTGASSTRSPAPTQTATPTAAGTATTSAAASTAHAVVLPLSDAEWARIVATGAWHPGCPASQRTLRRVEVGFHGFDGSVHRGALVVNADVAGEVARIFTRLFERGFPIHRMFPIEAYGGDDNASMAADNTSAYNCRKAGQANAPSTVSPHANGRAVDLNPYENPWVDSRCHCFRPDAFYGSHRAGRGVIVKGGVAWKAFTDEGWVWQDNPQIDYQHFDTGYPSRARR